jgi:hypothetical protein
MKFMAFGKHDIFVLFMASCEQILAQPIGEAKLTTKGEPHV